MVEKSIIRGLTQIIVVIIIAICARYLPPSCGGFVTGFIGVIIVDIYGILIEKGKL